MTQITDRKAQLLARLEELDELESKGSDERAVVTLDQQSVGRVSRVDLLQRQKMAEETYRRRRLERARLLAALKRIESDEYGFCAECGSEIGAGRLSADPAAHLCIDCAK